MMKLTHGTIGDKIGDQWLIEVKGEVWVNPANISLMERASWGLTEVSVSGRVICVTETPSEIMAMPQMVRATLEQVEQSLDEMYQYKGYAR